MENKVVENVAEEIKALAYLAAVAKDHDINEVSISVSREFMKNVFKEIGDIEPDFNLTTVKVNGIDINMINRDQINDE